MISKILVSFFMVSSLFVNAALAAGANPNAPQGGVLNYNLDAEPESLHPIMSGDLYGTYVQEYLFDSMCIQSEDTWALTPRIAEKWETSKDGLTFTFFLRKDAFFHNGENVTAEDVKFSFETIRDPKQTRHLRQPNARCRGFREVHDSNVSCDRCPE